MRTCLPTTRTLSGKLPNVGLRSRSYLGTPTGVVPVRVESYSDSHNFESVSRTIVQHTPEGVLISAGNRSEIRAMEIQVCTRALGGSATADLGGGTAFRKMPREKKTHTLKS